MGRWMASYNSGWRAGLAAKKRGRYTGLLTSHRRLRQRKQLRDAALAAMVRDDGPVATSELRRQAREIGGCSRHRAFWIKAIVPQGDGVLSSRTYHAPDGRS